MQKLRLALQKETSIQHASSIRPWLVSTRLFFVTIFLNNNCF